MENKEKRHQTEDREWLTDDIRRKIPKKSDNRCAFCGKKVFLDYGGTIDHFIPLKKGGTNDPINLVLMCKDCNEKKKSYVVPVSLGGKYLIEPYYTELEMHVDDYLQKFSYVSRGNLMGFDVYELFLIPEVLYNRSMKKNKKHPLDYKKSPYHLKRAYPEDVERLKDYLVNYLKKYNKLGSEEAALENIKFWMRFGVIYFVEVNDEVKVMSSMVVNKNGFISLNIFSYYSNALAVTLSKGIVKCLVEAVCREHDLPYCPVSVNILEEDSLVYKILKDNQSGLFNDFRCTLFRIANPDFNGDKTDGEDNVSNFLKNFSDVENDLNEYFYFNKLDNITWMADEILERKPAEK